MVVSQEVFEVPLTSFNLSTNEDREAMLFGAEGAFIHKNKEDVDTVYLTY